MKKVILLRHAKSSWSDPDLADHDRPLNPRGKASAPVIAQWLAHRKHLPDTILCSSAKRTKQTIKRMRSVLPELPDAKIEEKLYHASPDTMRERLNKLPKSCDTVLLVGHQPGIGALTRKLAEKKVRPRCARAFEHFPTAAAAVLEFDIKDWSELKYHEASFVDFAVPRELSDRDK
ncbi:histidine phosphatase family protein [Rhodobacteraceae bacterium NNCM2]|nr:histidine phosphatase family protein [Coraliihabitans acroporae]